MYVKDTDSIGRVLNAVVCMYVCMYVVAGSERGRNYLTQCGQGLREYIVDDLWLFIVCALISSTACSLRVVSWRVLETQRRPRQPQWWPWIRYSHGWATWSGRTASAREAPLCHACTCPVSCVHMNVCVQVHASSSDPSDPVEGSAVGALFS